MPSPSERLVRLNIVLPTAAPPVGSYVPYVIHQGMLYVSGQVSNDATGGIKGKLGSSLGIDQGQMAARLCAINLMSQLVSALGTLDRVERVVKLGGFVNAAADFAPIPAVINGCSDLFLDVFGEAGRHARSAVGCVNLPLDFAVEVDGIFAIRD